MTPKEALKQYWGYDSFRPMQEEIIAEALSGRDLLAILPTGGGKSVCFQVPSLLRDGITLVITPLIALMRDQVRNLSDRGIRALAVHAGMSRKEVDLALNNAAYGDYKFLYLSPERLSTPLFLNYIRQMNVAFLVVDEAHCISQWGYDFRPDYLRIGELRKVVDAPLIALTATATPAVADDIMDRLGFREKNLLRSGFERPNLSYVVRRCEDKNGQMLSIFEGVPGSGIVYVRNRKKAEDLSRFLEAAGFSVSFYHAGLSSAVRSSRQEDWIAGKIRIMVCTNAFGMGIDKPDVRTVVHYDLPDCPEAYFQEAGRAGRDGKRSYAVLLWNGTDLRRLDQIESVSFPSLEYIEAIYQKMHLFFEIPYDTGAGRQLKLDFGAFCRRYGLQESPAFHAIRYIGQEGHWTFTEDLDIKTRVQIIVDRRVLYEVDLPDPAMPVVLELLMRRYTGLFSFPVPVEEDYLSERAGLTVPAMRQVLYNLALEHLIKYIPADRADVVYLHHDRLRPGNVQLSPKRYGMLRDAFRSRKEAMVGYVSGEGECRQRSLLRYFGQESGTDCGHCDVCLGRVRSRKETEEKIVAWVHDRGGSYTLRELTAFFGNPAAETDTDFLSVLRELIDRGTVPPYSD